MHRSDHEMLVPKLLQRGTADGMSFPMAATHDFKLDEVTHYHVVAALGGGPGGVWMAKAKYLSLPLEAQKILDENRRG